MGHIVDFEGTVSEFKTAQDWCKIMLEGRWDFQAIGRDQYEFVFARGDEAALFEDRFA